MTTSILSNNYQMQSARQHFAQSNGRLNEQNPVDLGNFAQARGYMQNMASKGSMVESMSARHPSQTSGEAPTVKHQAPKNIVQHNSVPKNHESQSSLIHRHH